MDKLRPDEHEEKDFPLAILERAYGQAIAPLGAPFTADEKIQERIEIVTRGKGNKSCVRALLACSLAKVHQPQIDIRKPYTKIKARDTYSGRDYDERYVSSFATKYNLPVNATTAFLTPAFRNRNITLTPRVDLVGRPPVLYRAFLQLLDDIYHNRISAETLLHEAIRRLVIERNENETRLKQLLQQQQQLPAQRELAAEAIVLLIEHHLTMSGSSRLPVLIVSAAYQVAEKHLGERILPLEPHNAADKQTGSLGDLQVTLVDDSNIVTAYEMKSRPVTLSDIEIAITKIRKHAQIDNYIFITTESIEQGVKEYAAKMYARTGGVEIVVLDCIGFLRHFLHLFHRLRTAFLDAYQAAVLSEPDTAVGQQLKEAFLLLRAASERANMQD